MMLTSLELMRAAGISRATLNNYIALGLLPRPLVRNPAEGADTRARQIGYFPEDALARIERIRQLKKQGLPMAEIVSQLQSELFQPDAASAAQQFSRPLAALPAEEYPAAPALTSIGADSPSSVPGAMTGQLRVTIDQVPFPAYMVNYNFEITWYNEDASRELLGIVDRLPADIKERNALVYLLKEH